MQLRMPYECEREVSGRDVRVLLTRAVPTQRAQALGAAELERRVLHLQLERYVVLQTLVAERTDDLERVVLASLLDRVGGDLEPLDDDQVRLHGADDVLHRHD